LYLPYGLSDHYKEGFNKMLSHGLGFGITVPVTIYGYLTDKLNLLIELKNSEI